MLFDLADIAECKHLKTFSASRNNISSITQLRDMKLVHLNLVTCCFCSNVNSKSFNNISCLRDLNALLQLEELDLANNIILELTGIDQNSQQFLRILDISNNDICDPNELFRLQPLSLLSHLRAEHNPFVETVQNVPSKFEQRCFIKNAEYSLKDKYRFWILHHLHQLDILDGFPVSPRDLVRATNYFNPPIQVISAAQHGHLVKQKVKLKAKLREKSRLVGSIISPIVICGKKGSGKR